MDLFTVPEIVKEITSCTYKVGSILTTRYTRLKQIVNNPTFKMLPDDLQTSVKAIIESCETELPPLLNGAPIPDVILVDGITGDIRFESDLQLISPPPSIRLN